jgi:Flp pilus assembly protein protease CpaA
MVREMDPLLIIAIMQVSLLFCAAMIDIAARMIPNKICALLAILAIARLPFSDPSQLMVSVATTALLFATLFILYTRGYLGGGDVKLLSALAIGLSFTSLLQLLTAMSLAGGVIALLHLFLRRLPRPTLPPVGSSFLRRVYAIERWRNLRRAPLPYGVAIAAGGIWTLIIGANHVL